MWSVYVSEPDYDLGKVLKYQKPNPLGEDMYLRPDGTIESDEAKIVKAQRIFKHNYWQPEGRGARRVLEKYVSGPGQCPGSEEKLTTNKMAVVLSNLRPATFDPLLPAPSINDVFDGPENPTNKGLTDGPLVITSTYRGHAMFLENGAYVYRQDPKSPGGNGLVSIPGKGAETEECYVLWNGERLDATLNFV